MNEDDTIYVSMSLKDAKILCRILEHQYISYEDLEARETISKLFACVEESKNELARNDSSTT
jgi:hypothetical protein